MKRTISTGGAILLLTACVAPGRELAQRHLYYGRGRAQIADSDVVCDDEAPTGSHIRQRVCRSQAAIDQRRMMTQDMLRTTRGTIDDLDIPVIHVNVGRPGEQ
jgi:hypothetical protein